MEDEAFLKAVRSKCIVFKGGESFKIDLEPFNPRIHAEGTKIVSVRRPKDEGGHLIGLVEVTEFDVRVVYAFRTYRSLLDALAARLKERFR